MSDKRDSFLFDGYRNPIILHVALMGKTRIERLIVLYKLEVFRKGGMEFLKREILEIYFCCWFYFITEV